MWQLINPFSENRRVGKTERRNMEEGCGKIDENNEDRLQYRNLENRETSVGLVITRIYNSINL